ncbi:MFS general substrate transporter [Marasmius fiardii PR-910]|nr:MFS general substrate transporter [Marasmius fiardii PR-910]
MEKKKKGLSFVHSVSLPPSESTESRLDISLGVDENVVPEDTPQEVQDGGPRGWLTVAGSWFFLFSSLGYLYSWGVYQDYYTRIYLTSYSSSSIAWMGSLQLALPFLLGLPAGRLFDAGYIHSVIRTGSVLFLFCLFMLSLTKPGQYYQVFLCQGLGMGIGVGCIQLHVTTMVSRHFIRRRSFAYGIALTGSSVGSIVFPIGHRLIYSIGFPSAVRVSGYISLGGLVLGNLLIQSPARKFPSAPRTPFMEFVRDPAYMSFIFGYDSAAFISFFGFYFPIVYLQLYAVEQGINSSFAFYCLAVLNGSGVVGRLIGNYLADVFGLFSVHVPCTFITAGLIWVVLGVKNVGSLAVFAILYGMFSGAWLSLSLVATTVLSKSPSEIGARAGVCLGTVGISILVSAPLQGVVLGSDFSWIRSVAVSTVSLTVPIHREVSIVYSKDIYSRP